MADRLIRIKITLHSYLKEYLPPEAEGRIELDLAEGTTIDALSRQLGLPANIAVAVNDSIERDHSRVILQGDHVRFLKPGAGG